MTDSSESVQSTTQGRKNILIVDDEAITLKMTKQGLERFDFNVAIFSKPHDALDYFSNHLEKIDLIISDKNMPKMGGAELVKKMRLLHPTIPIIVLSGFISHKDDTILYENGASKILLKPLSIHDIIAEIKEVLEY